MYKESYCFPLALQNWYSHFSSMKLECRLFLSRNLGNIFSWNVLPLKTDHWLILISLFFKSCKEINCWNPFLIQEKIFCYLLTEFYTKKCFQDRASNVFFENAPLLCQLADPLWPFQKDARCKKCGFLLLKAGWVFVPPHTLAPAQPLLHGLCW